MAVGVLGVAWLASYAGLALIALTQANNRQRVHSRLAPPLIPSSLHRMRIAGSALLAAGVAMVLAHSGVSFGVPLAALLVSGAAYGVMATLAWAPGLFRLRAGDAERPKV